MARRARGRGAPAQDVPTTFRHHPFRGLSAWSQATPPPAPPAPPRPPATAGADLGDDAQVFAREMAGVVPLSAAARARIVPSPPPPPARAVTDPDAEVLAELSDLVSGSGSFDLANSVEFVEGIAAGVDRRLLRRLRAGEFAHRSYLDVHGLTAAEARVAVDRFLARAHARGERCVLLIHGRGLNSKDQIPVLKNRITAWLARGSWARMVLAFTSARPCDGGAGALYVLLRRRRAEKRPIDVTRGSNW